MTTETATGIQSTGTTDRELCVELLDEVKTLNTHLSEQSEQVEELQETVSEQQKTIEDLQAETESLEEALARRETALNYSHTRIDSLEERIDTLEESNREQHETVFAQLHQVEDLQSADSPDEPSVLENKTPLHQITNFTENMADKELDINLHRSWKIAKDITEYAEKTPKGYVIDSRDISNVFAAKEGTKPHPETTSRVMDYLEKYGKEDVTTRIHKGRRIAVVKEDSAEQYGKGIPPRSHCDVILAQGKT